MDDSFEHEVPGDELEAARRLLGELGEQPLPPAVATRLDARLDAELTTSPLSARRQRRRRLRLGASLSTAAALAAAVVFALSSGGGGHPAGGESATALRDSAAPVTADATAAKTAGATTERLNALAPPKKCPPPSRTGGDPRPAACPGARGGHARAV